MTKAERAGNMFIKTVRVMADYGSSGIWLVETTGGFRHSMLGHDSLQLPESLSEAFDQWIEHYWKALDDPDSYDEQWMISRGRELATELKRFLGPEVTVLYASEANVREDELIEI
jgi:hypothetical protein